MLLAEAVSIDGGALLLGLIVLLVLVAALVALGWWGCVLARRAAAGSSSALAGLLAVIALELLPAVWLGSIAVLCSPLGAVVLVQVAVFGIHRLRPVTDPVDRD